MFFRKKMNTWGKYATIALLSASLLAGCSKKNDDDDNVVKGTENISYAEDQLKLEHLYNNVDKVVERAFLQGAASIGSCVLISGDTIDGERVKYINFGSSCLCFDGSYRGGQITVYYHGVLNKFEEGYYERYNFVNYKVDNYIINGWVSKIHKGKDGSGSIVYNVQRVDSVTVDADKNYIKGNSSRTLTWYKGAETPQTSDDAYRLTGKGGFTSPDKAYYTIDIVKPLNIERSCNWITEGVINIYPENLTQRVLDYGNGQCEDDATVDVNGVKTALKLP